MISAGWYDGLRKWDVDDPNESVEWSKKDFEARSLALSPDGKLAAAAMDVTEQEPLPVTSELWDLPNVIITPHVGGQSARRIDDMTEFFCENIRRYRAGEPLVNLVDKRLGFPVRGGVNPTAR